MPLADVINSQIAMTIFLNDSFLLANTVPEVNGELGPAFWCEQRKRDGGCCKAPDSRNAGSSARRRCRPIRKSTNRS